MRGLCVSCLSFQGFFGIRLLDGGLVSSSEGAARFVVGGFAWFQSITSLLQWYVLPRIETIELRAL